MEKFADRSLWQDIILSLDIRRQYIKAILICAALIFLLLSLTRPQWGFEWQEEKQKGLDIVFAVDTSKSMLAEDIRPNRLERSKLAIRELVGTLRGDRAGLVAFAGEAFIQCPLTLDYDGFLVTLQDISVDAIPRGGTSITAGIKEAIGAFVKKEKKYRVLVIITDGEEHEGDALSTAREAKEQNIKIFCIGVGSVDGSPVPLRDKDGYKVFLEDEFGREVRSSLNEKLLKEIAFITGGAYIHSTRADFGLMTIYRQKIAQMERRDIKGKMHKQYHERFQIPLAITLILLCIEQLITERKRRE